MLEECDWVFCSDDRSKESAVLPGLESPSGASVESDPVKQGREEEEADHSKEPFHFIR